MSPARAIRYQGSDVALLRPMSCGRVRVAYLDGVGLRGFPVDVWPHDLIGNGWHLAAIKRAIAALTHTTTAAAPAPPRPLLFAHHVADHQRED